MLPVANADRRLTPDSARWNDWRWQMRKRIRSVAELIAACNWQKVPNGVHEAASRFPLAISPYYASLMQRLDPGDPVFAMSVPQGRELIDPPFLSDDPLEEERHTPVPGLVQRYSDRALLISTTICASYCRHCTRKRVTGQRESVISSSRLSQAVAYLRQNPKIRDVIVSGGDPLTLSEEALEKILGAIRSVKSVEIIRIGSRTPVTLPMRITDELTCMLRRYHPLWINTHFNHPQELTPQSSEACERLADAGIPLGNQTVLLREINDDSRVLETLFRGLLRIRVRPYYLHQCDLVRGVEHFRTPMARGIEIMNVLRGRLSGLAIPTFVVDVPNGGGKIPLLPCNIVSSDSSSYLLRNFEGDHFCCPEPLHFL